LNNFRNDDGLIVGCVGSCGRRPLSVDAGHARDDHHGCGAPKRYVTVCPAVPEIPYTDAGYTPGLAGIVTDAPAATGSPVLSVTAEPPKYTVSAPPLLTTTPPTNPVGTVVISVAVVPTDAEPDT